MKTRKLPIELEQQICKDYLDRIPVRKIAMKNNVSVATINNVRERNNLSNRRVAFTDEYRESIFRLYESVKSMAEVRKQTGLDRGTISKILQEFISKEDLINQPSINRTMVKINPFDGINNDRTKYFLGLLAADGCVEDRGSISLGLADKELIDEYVKFLGVNIKVHEYKDPRYPNARPIHHTKFVNREIANKLISLGVTPRKSKTLEIKIELDFSFLRGYIDGNGTINQESQKSIAVGISTASESFVNQVVKFLANNNINSTVFKAKDNSFTIRIGKKEQLLRLYDYMYSNASVWLERKRVKFDIIR